MDVGFPPGSHVVAIVVIPMLLWSYLMIAFVPLFSPEATQGLQMWQELPAALMPIELLDSEFFHSRSPSKRRTLLDYMNASVGLEVGVVVGRVL